VGIAGATQKKGPPNAVTVRQIVTLLSVSVLCCRTSSPTIDLTSSVADAIFVGAKASFCDGPPRLVETTRPLFPFVALAQGESGVSGEQLLALIDKAERYEGEFERRYVPQRFVLPPGSDPHALISNEGTKKDPGCYAELSPLIENPYRTGESGAFLRIFRGGPVGRSGSTTFWLVVNREGSAGRLVALPFFVD
jgi:hypothetical protein